MLGFFMRSGTSLLAASGKACSVPERLLQFRTEVTDLLTLTNRHMRLPDPDVYTVCIYSGYVTLHTTYYYFLWVSLSCEQHLKHKAGAKWSLTLAGAALRTGTRWMFYHERDGPCSPQERDVENHGGSEMASCWKDFRLVDYKKRDEKVSRG